MEQSEPSNALVEFVERLRAERAYWKKQRFEPLPEPPEEPLPNRYKLSFRPGLAEYRPVISLSAAREQIETKMLSYIREPKPARNLLIQAQPGVGKTHIAADVAQRLASDQGLRVLYAMQNHAHFETIQNMPHARNDLWYHWLALSAESPVTGNTMCQYADAMGAWTKKGYPAMKLCDSLCSMYKTNCEYRRQVLREERIIAGTHDHVALGMQISDFDVAFVDELPLAAFLRQRHIPLAGVRLEGAGPVVELSEALASAAAALTDKQTVKGKALLDQIGALLVDVYAQFEDYESALPLIPWISRPSDVERAAYWYMPDLLMLLVQERAAWEAQQSEWLERVVLTHNGLDLLKRADPWDSLPAHTIMLDATGSSALYRQIFDREVEAFSPNVERQGKIYQVTTRLNGIGTFLEVIPGEKTERRTKKRRLSVQGIEALDWCDRVIALGGFQRPGCVTFMDAVPEFEAVFGKGRVLHYFAQRGSNDLIDADAGFVVGCPQPADADIMRMVTMLYPRRIQPYHLVERDDGHSHPARTEEARTYQYFDARGQAGRVVSGFWSDLDLNVMADAQREQEIVQAIHRFRPITRIVPVYVLTSVPTAERLDGIYDEYTEALEAATGQRVPAQIANWRAWLRLQPQLMEWHITGQAVTYSTIAGALGIPENTIRRQKWLDAIQAEYPDLWQFTQAIVPVSDRRRGQPEKAIFPNNARVPLNTSI